MDIHSETRSSARGATFHRKVLVRACSFTEKFNGVGLSSTGRKSGHRVRVLIVMRRWWGPKAIETGK